MNLYRLNLNLLIALDSLFSEQSVTLAANKLFITQAAMSNNLSQLRKLFNDELLVREKNQMILTNFAKDLQPKLHQVLQEIQVLVEGGQQFTPQTSQREFRLAMNDYMAGLFVPELLNCVQRSAPQIKITVISLSRVNIAGEERNYDLIIDKSSEMQPHAKKQPLFTDSGIILLNKQHPLAKKSQITVKDYLSYKHIAVRGDPYLQQHFGFYASFVFMLGYGLVLLFLILTRFKETIQKKNLELSFSSTLTNYIGLLKNSGFMRYAIIAGLAFSSIIIYANVVPFIAQNQFHLSAIGSGALLLVSALGICLGSLISSKIVARLGPAYLINLGLILYMSNGLVLLASHYFFPHTLALLILPLILITMGCGFIFPNAIALCFSDIKTNIGTAGSIYGAMQTFISMLFNFALNLISTQNQTLLGILYFLIGLMGVIIILLGRKSFLLSSNLNDA